MKEFLAWQIAISKIVDGMMISELTKSCVFTYSHMAMVVDSLEENGLIYTEMVGRRRILRLSAKGKLIKDNMIPIIKNIVGEIENEM